MPTDDERREVARRLRERAGKRVLNLGELLWCIGCDDGDNAAAWNRLADLIEPSEPKVKCVAEVKVDGERLEKLVHDAVVEYTGVDREALLETLSCMDAAVRWAGPDVERDIVEAWADDIRKALVVES